MDDINSTGPAKKRPSRTPTIGIKLSAADYARFSTYCRSEGRDRTDVARQAILELMDRQDDEHGAEIRDRLADVLERMEHSRRKDTERLAKLAARTLIDVGIINQVFYRRAASDDREELWSVARKSAVSRLKAKRKDGDEEATEIMKHVAGEISS